MLNMMTKHQQLTPFSIAGIVITIIGLAFSVYAITQSTEFRQRASEGAVLYVTGTPDSAAKGQTIIVKLDVDSKEIPVQTATVVLTYPLEKLKFEKLDFNKSSFDMTGEQLHSQGLIRISRDASTPTNGKSHIATIHFTAIDTVALTEIKPQVGTAIISTENKNIYTNAVRHTASTKNEDLDLFSSLLSFFNSLIGKRT